MFDWIFTKERIWKNKDFDIPVTLIKRVGSANGVEYAEVQFEGKTSFVPYKELFRK